MDTIELGYHIAKSAVNPNTLYLGEGNIFVGKSNALLFLNIFHARDYAERIGLELGDIRNVIVLCECPETIREQHLLAVI